MKNFTTRSDEANVVYTVSLEISEMGLFVSTKHCQVCKVSRSIPNFEKVKYHQEKFENKKSLGSSAVPRLSVRSQYATGRMGK